jgi:hypothetical protein
MAYSLAQAAEACGVNRSTILRAIKSGKISGMRDANGAWEVEPVELHRVFPPTRRRAGDEAMPSAVPEHAQPDALVAELRAQLAEMRSQRDAWQGIAERLALAAPRQEAVARDQAGAAKTAPEKLSWWRWLRSTG